MASEGVVDWERDGGEAKEANWEGVPGPRAELSWVMDESKAGPGMSRRLVSLELQKSIQG